MSALEPTSHTSGLQPNSFFLQRTNAGWHVIDNPSPLYVIAVASNDPVPPISPHSSLADPGMEMVRDAPEAVEAERGELASQVGVRDKRIAVLESELAVAHKQIQRVEMSVTWRLFVPVRRLLFAALGGERSAAAEELQRALRSVGRLVFGAKGSDRSSG